MLYEIKLPWSFDAAELQRRRGYYQAWPVPYTRSSLGGVVVVRVARCVGRGARTGGGVSAAEGGGTPSLVDLHTVYLPADAVAEELRHPRRRGAVQEAEGRAGGTSRSAAPRRIRPPHPGLDQVHAPDCTSDQPLGAELGARHGWDLRHRRHVVRDGIPPSSSVLSPVSWAASEPTTARRGLWGSLMNAA